MTDSPNTDIRWREVWATVCPYERTAFDIRTNTRKEPMVTIFIEVRWEGERFTARYLVERDAMVRDATELNYQLDKAVEAIDAMMLEHGFPPYLIRSE